MGAGALCASRFPDEDADAQETNAASQMDNPDSSWVPPVAGGERRLESAASGDAVAGTYTGSSASSAIIGSAAEAAGAAVGSPGEQCAGKSSRGVVWVSIDPRVGAINIYPHAVAERLEAEHERLSPGARVNVPLGGCGGVFEGASVEIGGGEPPVQKTSRGKRDVRRVEVPADASRVSLNVLFSRAWRISDEPHPGNQERHVEVSRDCMILVGGGADDALAEERSQAVKAGDEKGLVSLWEWSRLPELEAPSSWGLYGEEQVGLIESAFREGKRSVEVSVGIRTYEVIFEGSDGGKQVDRALHKRRLVRRRLVAPDQRDAELRAAAEAVAVTCAGDPEGECAVCCADFAETPTLPVVRLPECGHLFHCACIQEIADRGDPCPLCRGAVDWKTALKAR